MFDIFKANEKRICLLRYILDYDRLLNISYYVCFFYAFFTWTLVREWCTFLNPNQH